MKLDAGYTDPTALLQGFEEMGERAEEMIRVALRSFAERDLERPSRSWSWTS